MAVSILAAVAIDAHAQRGCAQKEATSWEITIAGPDEPGDRLVVEGVVTGPDGKPLEGVVVYAYHTDAAGDYGPGDLARLCGLMKTDAQGRYRFHSIRPASYPNQTFAAHVHFVVSGAGVVEQQLLLEFEGDQYLSSRAIERDRAAAEGLPDTYRGIRPLEKRENGYACRKDIRVQTR